MADEQTTRAATSADETAPGQVGTTEGQARDAETPEQKLQRELENERGKQAAWQARIAEEQRSREAAEARVAQLEAQGPPPTPGLPANPLQQLVQRVQGYEALLAENPGNFAVQDLLDIARTRLAAAQWESVRQRESPKFERLSEPVRSKAIECFNTGKYPTAEDATLVAEGLIAREGRNKSAAEEARRKAADEAAAKAAQSKPDTGGGSGSEPVATKRRPLTGSEFTRMTQTKTGEARKLLDDYDNGRVEVDWAR